MPTMVETRHDVRGRKTTPQQRSDVRAAKPLIHPDGAGSYNLSYGNGPLVECLYTYPVFVGTKWQDNAQYAAMAGEIQVFLTDIFSSPFMNVLQQYGYLSGVFGAAHFEGSPGKTILSDSDVQNMVANLHASGVIPDDVAATSNLVNVHAAILFLDDTVGLSDSVIGGSFCAPDLIYGYHYYNVGLRPTPIYYGVIANLSDACVTGDPNLSTFSQLARLTIVASHEIAELVSDPQPGSGWYSQFGGEIGDICEGSDASFSTSHPDGSVNTWNVQNIYSLYDDEHGTGICVSSTSAARSVPTPAAKAGDAPGKATNLRKANLGAAGSLLPLPPTHKIGGKITYKPADLFTYARRLMADVPASMVHGNIPSLLRQMADVLERAESKSDK